MAIPFHVHYVRGEWESACADIDYCHMSAFDHNLQLNIMLKLLRKFYNSTYMQCTPRICAGIMQSG